MRFTVLGPVRAWRDDAELELGPPKQRALLALLLTQAGQPVAVHEILDVLWGQHPPDSAVNVVHRHIGSLRRMLEPQLTTRTASRRLIRGSGGYRLNLETDALDLRRFRALRDEARVFAEEGSPGKATEVLIEALGLWRGPTASGLAPQVRAHPVFTTVDREHLLVVKEAAQTALDAGPGLTERILVTLRASAAHHPLDEALQARLIVVLAATGHQAEALGVYQAVRDRLADELGLDPGPELRAAQQQVLRQTVPVGTLSSGYRVSRPADNPPNNADQAPAADQVDAEARQGHPARPRQGHPASDVTDDTSDEAPYAPRTPPAQLPADLSAFTGRRSELARSHALLPEEGDTTGPVVISAIGGMAGVGKTTLAVHWAHEIAHRFPDGQLYVNLRGFHPTGSVMSPAEAIRTFLNAFGIPSHRIPVGLDAQAALYRSLLADRRVLVLLDNARDTEQVRPLLPGAPGCLAIVTSRNQLHGLIAGEGARPIAVDLPTLPDAREFLIRRLGAERVASERQAADEIIRLCGRLPLALAIVCARASVNPSFSLSAISTELREGHGSLDAFAGGDPVTDARSVFSWSYRTLTPGAARMFRLLSLHPGPECSYTAAARLAGLPIQQIRPSLAELVRAHLLTEQTLGRFISHELLRAYAAELSRAEDPKEMRRDARRRLFDHYLHSAHAADALLGPHRERITLSAPVTGALPEKFSSETEAADWLTSERCVLQAVLEQDGRSGTGKHCWQLASTLELFLDRRGRWEEQLAVQTAAMTAAQRLGTLAGQAHAHRALGFAEGRLARYDEAHTHLLRALEMFREIGDLTSQGRVHRYLGFLSNSIGEHAKALQHYRQACGFYRAADEPSGQAGIYNEVGWTHILLGEYEDALNHCRQALALDQKIGDRNGEAAAWDSLGYAYHHLGQHHQAQACYGHALELYREIRDVYLEANTLVHVGETYEAAGAVSRAVAAWRQALDILETFDHPEAEQIRTRIRRLDDITRRAALFQPV